MPPRACRAYQTIFGGVPEVPWFAASCVEPVGSRSSKIPCCATTWPRAGPLGDIGLLMGQAQPVAAVGKDVQGERHAVPAEGSCKGEAVFHRHGRVVGSVPEKGRRCFGAHLGVARQGGKKRGIRGFAEEIPRRPLVGEGTSQGDDGVAEDGKVGAGALAFDGIRGHGIAAIEMGRQRGGEVSACRKAQHADAVRIDVPLACRGGGRARMALLASRRGYGWR